MPQWVNNVYFNIKERYEFASSRLQRTSVVRNSSLAVVLMISFMIRFLPLLRYDIVLKANDTYSQIKVAEYIDMFGLSSLFSWTDPFTWYPWGRYFGESQYIGTPMSAIIFRDIMGIIGFKISLYEAAYIVPGVLGVLTVYAVYLLGKEVSDDRVGLIAAFFISINPGHIQRSMVGFFDNEALGVLLLVLTFYFFMRSLRSGSVLWGIIGGISLGFLSMSWGAAEFGFQLIALYAFILLLTKKYSTRLLTSYSLVISIGLGLSALVPRNGPVSLMNSDALLTLGVLGLLLIVDFYTKNREFFVKFIKEDMAIRLGLTIVMSGFTIFILGILLDISFLIPFKDKFLSVLVPFFRTDTPILASVAEHLIMTWASLFKNLNIQAFFLPVGIIYTYEKGTEKNIFILLFGFVTLYFAGSMTRLILILAPAAAVISAKAVNETLLPYALTFQDKFTLSHRKSRISSAIGKDHVAIAFILIFTILFYGLFQATNESINTLAPAAIALEFPDPSTGGIVKIGDWQETLMWIEENTDQTATIASWWDYGYWINTNTNRTILVDNATINSTQIGNIGALLIGAPDLSLEIAYKYKVNYILVVAAAGLGFRGFDNDLGKVQWMVRIADQNSDMVDIQKEDYLQESGPYIEKYVDKFYDSIIWRILTEGTAADEVYNQMVSQETSIVSEGGEDTRGFTDEYQIYGEVFREAYFSMNRWIRIYEVDYDRAFELDLLHF